MWRKPRATVQVEKQGRTGTKPACGLRTGDPTVSRPLPSWHIRNTQGTTVVREGDRADAFYIVYRGRLEVRVRDQVIAVLEDGDHFGEVALVLNTRRTASIVATTPVTCLRLHRDAFVTLMTSNEDLERSIVRASRERLASVRMSPDTPSLR